MAAIAAADADEAVPGPAALPGDDALPLLLPGPLPLGLALTLVVELLSLQIVFLATSREAFPINPGATAP